MTWSPFLSVYFSYLIEGTATDDAASATMANIVRARKHVRHVANMRDRGEFIIINISGRSLSVRRLIREAEESGSGSARLVRYLPHVAWDDRMVMTLRLRSGRLQRGMAELARFAAM